jgi:hypothetical protein
LNFSIFNNWDKKFFPSIKNAVGIWKQIIILNVQPSLHSFIPLYRYLIFLFLLWVASSLILSFRYSFFLFLKWPLDLNLTFYPHLPLFGLDNATIAIWLVFVDLIVWTSFIKSWLILLQLIIT